MKLVENLLGRVTKPVRGVLAKITGLDLPKWLESAAIGLIIVLVLIIAIEVIG